MTKHMLIDATHAEETRVVVLDGNRIEDFDVETSAKRQLKGNIYLAKIVRVEPSLQAAFVEYGGGRHGFLAFGEIHPDYYQIPVADRQRLLALQAEEARAEAEAEDAEDDEPVPAPGPALHAAAPRAADPHHAEDTRPAEASMADRPADGQRADVTGDGPPGRAAVADEPVADEAVADEAVADEATPVDLEPEEPARPSRPAQAAAIERDERFGPHAEASDEAQHEPHGAADPADAVVVQTAVLPPEPSFAADDGEDAAPIDESGTFALDPAPDPDGFADLQAPIPPSPPPETLGGEADSGAEEARRRRESRFLRNYRIQEVIRRRQVILVQVVKEERGTKGAALTTYISLAGRFSVLMPNSPRGGGISRKITSAADRRRLKEVTAELDLPTGMGLIVRTAGANRPKPEIKRDCEYLMRLWDDIREHTLRSIAPALIYEEASLIKRAIRDVYSRDIDDIIVDGEAGWRAAHEFMRMLMPSHAKKVQLWRGEGGQPLFAKHQVEAQLDAMLSPTVQLKSGGYLVINPTEALVSIDVNSGRSTRERNIEETAFRTNLEAAEEAARQLRLRDLAGLIVIDFIDMEVRKNNAAVERRLKEALQVDRARIQVGSISHFGLLEMSRQRLRPSVTETSFIACPHCGGSGHVRSTESAAIHVLRAIEEEGARGRAAVVMVYAASSLVMFLLNHKRDRLGEIEARSGMRVQFAMDEQLMPPQHRIEKIRARSTDDRPLVASPVLPAAPATDGPDEDVADLEADDPIEADSNGGASASPSESAEDSERRRRRRRRRRGSRRDGTEGPDIAAENGTAEPGDAALDAEQAAEAARDSASWQVQPRLPLDPAQADQPEIGEPEPGLPPRMIAAAAGDDVAAAEASGPPDPEAEAADGEAGRGRRRGRRGGRRRRRDDGEAESGEAAAPVPDAFAVPDASMDQPSGFGASAAYRGPTPADPFGGAGDIYDLLDTAAPPAEAFRPVAMPAARRRVEAPAEPEPASAATADLVADPADIAPVARHGSAANGSDVVQRIADIESETAPAAAVLVNDEQHDHAAIGAPAAERPMPPLIGPAIQPVVIGATAVAAEPKRGWWRR